MNIENEKFQIVAQDNRICQIAYAENASHELNICQKRLILLMISRINKNDKDSLNLKVYVLLMQKIKPKKIPMKVRFYKCT